MDLGLAGKVVLVTGATANIGRAIALDFAAERVRLIATGRDEAAGRALVGQARRLGAEDVRFVAADLLDPDTPARLLAEADAAGGIDVLVNNVGGNTAVGLFADSDPASWLADLDITLMTTLRMTHTALPGMIARKRGRIVNIGSTAGIVGDYMLPVYSAAKAAVHGFTKVLAKEVGQHGITVNCVAPYATMASDPAAFSSGSRFHPEQGFFTHAFGQADPSEVAKLQRSGPLGRTVATPEEVAFATLYLASDRASFVTGQIIHVDGGTLL